MSTIPLVAPQAKKVLLIGWDGADWRVIRPLIEQGKMPNLKRFLAEGVSANLSTIQPCYSPMVWTSIATGKRPFKHGIHGFTEPTPDGAGVRPVTNLSRTTKAIWNILHQMGKTCNVVGWWPSHPAEPVRGVMVSNHYQHAVGHRGQPWPITPGTIHPQRLIQPLTEFRVHPEELGDADLDPFVPRWREIDQEKDHRISSLAKTVAETASIHAAATAVMQLEPWDLMAVYYDGIDHFSHGFMRYHPPRQPRVNQTDFHRYQGVIEGAYRFHDLMLGTVLALAGEDTTVLLMSDHGFHPDALRPKQTPAEPAGPAVQHRNQGIFAMKGPNLRKDDRLYGASVLDICPTVLRLFGLPIGSDMDGKALLTAFESVPELCAIPSWDQVPGDDGRHPPHTRLDPVESVEVLRQLAALGYVEPPPDNASEAVAEALRELKYNLAQSYLDGGHAAKAQPLLEEIWARWPQEHRFGQLLLHCLSLTNQKEQRRKVLDQLETNINQFAAEAKTQLSELREKRTRALTQPEDPSVKNKPEREEWEQRRIRKLARSGRAQTPPPSCRPYSPGTYLFAVASK